MTNPLLFEHNQINNTLFLQLRKGDEQALAQFYQRSFPALLRYANYVCNETFEAGTIVQDAILKTWQLRHKLESLHHAYCFIKLQIRWLSYDYLQKRVKERKRFISLDNAVCTDILLFNAWNNAIANTDLIPPEQLQAVNTMLNNLPPKTKTMLDLYFGNGLPVGLIAERFGCSRAAVTATIQKSIHNIQQAVKPGKKAVLSVASVSCAPLAGSLQQIVQLRDQSGYAFTEIATVVQLPVLEVLKKYMEAKEQKSA